MTVQLTRLPLLFFGLFFVFTSATLGQSVPADFVIMGTAGGRVPDAETATVRIGADGNGSYVRFEADDPGAPLLESNVFTLSAAQVAELWQAILANDFFGLPASHANEEIDDRTFAVLAVVADGATHTVTTRNVAVTGFDTIVSTLNRLTPGDDDLVYDTSEPFTVVPLDVCEQPGKRTGISIFEGGKKWPAGVDVLPVVALGAALEPIGEAHPGTVVAYHMGLEEAVDKGIISFEGKGTFFGDAISITADNSANKTSDRIVATLYLEFWGPEASAATAQVVEESIERIWGGRTTSDGKTLDVDVVTRVSPGGSSAPGTSGYHQIQLVESVRSSVTGREETFDVNQGTGSGFWETVGGDLDRAYAHEAGHLLGFPDRYEEFLKQPDSTWKDENGKPYTTDQLAAFLDPRFSDRTEAELKAKLNDLTLAAAPRIGSENDLMGIVRRDPTQSDIDALAGKAGLLVEVRPGDVLANENGRQHMVVTRNEDIFVSPGGTTTLNGIYAACLDRHKGEPEAGDGFDLAPSLSEWNGFEAARHLQSFLDYVDREDLYCGFHGTTQLAVWRLTDNSRSGDPATNDFVDALLREAGVDVGDRFLDFPHMTNSNAENPETTVIMPRELFVAAIESSAGDIIQVDVPVPLSASLRGPTLEGISVDYTWTVAATPGTEASLSQSRGETTILTVRDNAPYRVRLEAILRDGASEPDTVRGSVLFSAPNARTETFESGQLVGSDPFRWRTSGNMPWVVDATSPNTGAFSAASGEITDLETSQLKVEFENATDGPFSFAFKVSSEPVWDVLRFELDGVELARWSGNFDWTGIWQIVRAGSHTAVWTYEKDGLPFRSVGLDRAWLDDVYFPPGAVFTAIEASDGEGVPVSYELFQNYPNPFNPTTTLGYVLHEPQDVRLVVYDAAGREVAVLVDGRQNGGRHQAQFNAQGLAGGVYYYELTAGEYGERRAMVLRP